MRFFSGFDRTDFAILSGSDRCQLSVEFEAGGGCLGIPLLDLDLGLALDVVAFAQSLRNDLGVGASHLGAEDVIGAEGALAGGAQGQDGDCFKH